jgi:hypothetical protein
MFYYKDLATATVFYTDDVDLNQYLMICMDYGCFRLSVVVCILLSKMARSSIADCEFIIVVLASSRHVS